MGLFDISLDLANQFYSWGWRASLVGAGITLIGVLLLMWGTRVRDHDFESQMTTLNKEAATSRKQTAELERGNLELQRVVEKERSERLKLESKIAPRQLSESDKKALIAALKPFAGQKCVITSMLGNVESKVFAEDWIKVLETAGWDHSGDDGIVEAVFSNPVFGIQITVHQSEPGVGTATEGIMALIKTARSLGLTEGPEFYQLPEVPAGTVNIKIGAKP